MGELTLHVALLAALVAACYSQSTPRPCPQYQCPDSSYQPVCGTDNVTYHNACYMEAATCSTVDVNYPGECRDFNSYSQSTPRPCPQYQCPDSSYRPVCGTDNVTYHNACYMEAATCSTVDVNYPGECRDLNDNPPCDPNSACHLLYLPVCGSNNVTYGNQCFFEAQTCGTEITKAYDGVCTSNPPCDPNRACNLLYAPVCGSNGVTYANQCSLEGQTCGTGVTKVHNGACIPTTNPEV